MKSPPVTWAALLEIALCDQLGAGAKMHAVDELRKLTAYLDDQLFFDRCGELDVTPFNVGKPLRDADPDGVPWR